MFSSFTDGEPFVDFRSRKRSGISKNETPHIPRIVRGNPTLLTTAPPAKLPATDHNLIAVFKISILFILISDIKVFLFLVGVMLARSFALNGATLLHKSSVFTGVTFVPAVHLHGCDFYPSCQFLFCFIFRLKNI